MFNTKNNQTIAFCTAVKYTHKQTIITDYSSSPRLCHNLAFMLDGQAVIQSGGNQFTVKKGDIFFISRHSTYCAKWEVIGGCSCHSVHFNFTASQDPFLNETVPVQILPSEDFDALYEQVKILQAHQYKKNADRFLAFSAFYYLCGILLPKVLISQSQTKNSSISPALAFLENNYTEHCSVEELASLCFLSPSRFYYLFKQHTGYSPIVYKNRLTVQRVAQTLLLEKDKSVESISDEYGFESPIYFRRLFKKITGKTPTQYRKEETLL